MIIKYCFHGEVIWMSLLKDLIWFLSWNRQFSLCCVLYLDTIFRNSNFIRRVLSNQLLLAYYDYYLSQLWMFPIAMYIKTIIKRSTNHLLNLSTHICQLANFNNSTDLYIFEHYIEVHEGCEQVKMFMLRNCEDICHQIHFALYVTFT